MTTTRIAAVQLATGTVLLVVSILLAVSCLCMKGAPGDRLSIALFLLLVALPLLYPTMLREGGPNVSSMRVALYLVVGLFSVTVARVAWHATTVAELKLDPWWATILSAAIGGKAVQSLGETNMTMSPERPTIPPPLAPRPTPPA